MDILDEESKEKILNKWKDMSESDKGHFINQVALALSIWGSGPKGKQIVIDVLDMMSNNGTTTLADFGLFIERLPEDRIRGMKEKIERATLIIEGYRIKHALPSEPHRELF